MKWLPWNPRPKNDNREPQLSDQIDHMQYKAWNIQPEKEQLKPRIGIGSYIQFMNTSRVTGSPNQGFFAFSGLLREREAWKEKRDNLSGTFMDIRYRPLQLYRKVELERYRLYFWLHSVNSQICRLNEKKTITSFSNDFKMLTVLRCTNGITNVFFCKYFYDIYLIKLRGQIVISFSPSCHVQASRNVLKAYAQRDPAEARNPD